MLFCTFNPYSVKQFTALDIFFAWSFPSIRFKMTAWKALKSTTIYPYIPCTNSLSAPRNEGKQPQWFQIHYGKNIKTVSSSQSLPAQEKLDEYSRIFHYRHPDRGCWLNHLRERIKHTPVSPHLAQKREKRPKIPQLYWLGWVHVKGKPSSLAPLCGSLIHQKQHGHCLMFKPARLGKACFLNCE